MSDESNQALAEVLYDLVATRGLRLTPEALAIVVSVWSDTVGVYMTHAAAEGRTVWDNPRMKRFIMKWAVVIADRAMIRSASRATTAGDTTVNGDDMTTETRQGITDAHAECADVIEHRIAAADPEMFAKYGPFCTAFLGRAG